MADQSYERVLDVLVVDDEPRIRQMVQRCLSRDGHRVAAASSGEEAEEIAEERVFYLIFLDLRLQGTSGLDLIPLRRVVEAADTLDEAADVLGIDPATLWRRRKKYREAETK